MPEPRLTILEESKPTDDVRRMAHSVFNLFPLWDVRAFGEIDSTNTEARRIALAMSGDAWPRVILADVQKNGHGRQGRRWVAPSGTSLLVTFMVPIGALRFVRTFMPLAVSCWLMEGFESLGLSDVAVKWPNDVLVRGQKISGILCQTVADAFIVGIGINLTQHRQDLPMRAPTEPQATSVALEMGAEWPGRLSASLTLLNAVLASFEHPAGPESILGRYRNRCVTLGKSVAFPAPHRESIVGLAEDVEPGGALVVNVPGKGRTLVAQTIEGAE